jgi:hypothetical protein
MLKMTQEIEAGTQSTAVVCEKPDYCAVAIWDSFEPTSVTSRNALHSTANT